MPRAMPVLPQRYVSPELVARGGMADVFRARDDMLERVVAVKVLGERVAADPELRTRFSREARTAATLSGVRNVVTVYDVGEGSGGRPYIVMEYLAGGSVADRLRCGALPPAQALEWLEQAARGLDAAHAIGIVHRDVKPANLMLSTDGEVQVTDFGIARAAGDGSLTTTGTILGTAGYMAPEQALGERATTASDRYALAVVAFELLTGQRPFAGDSQTAEAAAHAHAPVPRASAVNPELPEQVNAVLAGGLAKDPLARPSSCGAFVDSLRRAFHDSAEVTRRVVPSAERSQHRARAPRRRGVAALAVAALLTAVGLGLSGLASRGEPLRSVQTIVRTQTRAGETQTRTVTLQSQTPDTAVSASPSNETSAERSPATSGESGPALNDEGYRHLREGDVDGALPLLERAVQLLAGSGSNVEAYASYNLALARYSLGSCDAVLELLDRSEQVQGKRKEISRLRKHARKSCER